VSAPPPIFEAEGVSDCLDEVALRHVSVWLAAVEDERGAVWVLVDLVQMVAPPLETLAAADGRADVGQFRGDGTTLHTRLRLLPHEARRLAAALTVVAFAADQRFS
jgi:hypothetical protein